MRIAARLNLALDVARLTAGAEQVLEAIVVWLQIIVGDAPILDGEVRIEKILAVSFARARRQLKIVRLKAVGLAIPMHHGATEARARKKGLPAPNRQSHLRSLVAKRHRFAGVVLHHGLANIEAQFVMDGGALELGNGESNLAALQSHHFIARGREFLGNDAADHADADDDDIDFFETLHHGDPLREWAYRCAGMS